MPRSIPSSGIMDTNGIMNAYLGDIESNGGAVAFNAEVVGVRTEDRGFALEILPDLPVLYGVVPC